MEGQDDHKLHSLSEMWLVSAPGDVGGDGAYQSLHHAVRKLNGGYVFKFNLPELKVCNRDFFKKINSNLIGNIFQ